MTRTAIRIVVLVGVLAAIAAPAFAQTAGMLSFQGLLKDASGARVNGAVTLQFRIYDAQTAGTLVDMDGDGTVEDVIGQDAKEIAATATNGVVSTKFGPVSPKAFNGSARWLEVRVNGTALSRTELATAAATAEQVNGQGSGSPVLYTLADGSLRTRGKDDNTYVSLYSEGMIGVRTSGYNGARFAAKDLRDVAGAEAGLYLYLGSDPDTVNDVAIVNSGGDLRFHVPLGVERMTVTKNGEVRVRVLSILGGSDLAEPFAVLKSKDNSEKTEPGMVVAIDPDNPGQLRLAREPYDRRVAGVISGANGLKPGMVMSGLAGGGRASCTPSEAGGTPAPHAGASADARPETRDPKPAESDTLTPSLSLEGRGRSDDEHPVALTGRVYVWADASYGPIEPGDMLTTSATPGHAMKATDREKSFGAVIGKSMMPLKQGKGLVLVLVSLQ